MRPGSACTVLAAAAMVKPAVEAAASAGIDAEVIDLRTLDPLGLDWATVSASLARTHRALVVEQTARGHGIGARIVQEMQGALLRPARPRDPAGHRQPGGAGGLAAAQPRGAGRRRRHRERAAPGDGPGRLTIKGTSR